jgi:uncharacterized membrane protein YbhN (UPF0104 family)
VAARASEARLTAPRLLPAGRARALLVPAVVSVVAVVAVVWWASRQQLPDLPAASVALPRLAIALALYALATALRGERWLRLWRDAGARLSRTDAYAVTTVGYMGNNALPARAGDLLKSVLSSRQTETPTADGFGTLVAERVTRRLWSATGAGLLALSIVIWLVEGSVYAVLGAVAGVHLSLLDGLYIMALANLVALVPAAPGYLGTFDAAVLLGVRLVAGGTHAAALAYAVVVRFVLFVPITVVGLAVLVVRYGGLRRVSVALRRPATAVPVR